MPLGGAKDEHFSCFHSSCQLGLNPLTGKKCDNTFSPVILWLTFYCAMSNCQICIQMLNLILGLVFSYKRTIFTKDHMKHGIRMPKDTKCAESAAPMPQFFSFRPKTFGVCWV